MCMIGNHVYGKPYRGFESPPLRQCSRLEVLKEDGSPTQWCSGQRGDSKRCKAAPSGLRPRSPRISTSSAGAPAKRGFDERSETGREAIRHRRTRAARPAANPPPSPSFAPVELRRARRQCSGLEVMKEDGSPTQWCSAQRGDSKRCKAAPSGLRPRSPRISTSSAGAPAKRGFDERSETGREAIRHRRTRAARPAANPPLSLLRSSGATEGTPPVLRIRSDEGRWIPNPMVFSTTEGIRSAAQRRQAATGRAAPPLASRSRSPELR